MEDVKSGVQPESDDEQEQGGLNRRAFLAALAGAAAAGTLLERGGELHAQSPQTYWYFDSFGNVVAAAPDAIAAGITPPPLPAGVAPPGSAGPAISCGGGTYISNPNQPNILLIMVDQLRWPRWLSSGQYSAYQSLVMPNVFGGSGTHSLRQESVNFQNFFVAATACTPSRCTFLTGLYSQQTCMFQTQQGGNYPSLQPYQPVGGVQGWGFPTIGDVLQQNLPINCGAESAGSSNYQTAWIGKWHVSDYEFGAGRATVPGHVHDPRKGRVVELRFFGGLTAEETSLEDEYYDRLPDKTRL